MKTTHSFLPLIALAFLLLLPSLRATPLLPEASMAAEVAPVEMRSFAPIVAALAEATQPVVVQADTLSSHVSEDAGEEIDPPPTPIEPAVPARLRIPAINVSAPVRAMGVESDGKMAVPNNFTEIGWWGGGARPGAEGAAVMGAHVDDGLFTDGVFKNLHQLEVGDLIHVEDTNGIQRVFHIVETKLYDYKERDTASVFLAPGKKALRLITCHGTWLPAENTYDSRFIVFAELIE